MSNEAPILVAPRPVRLSQAFFHLQRDADDSLKLAFNVPDSRTSPRSPLPSEALEEFLSILTPSFLRKPRPLAFPAFMQDPQRALALRSQASCDPAAARSPPVLQLLQDQLLAAATDDQHPAATPPPRPAQLDADPRCWPFSGAASALLSSPVSRLHTRNPFYHHDDIAARFPSPVPASSSITPLTPLTPAAVPLPTPSPDELIERLDGI